MYIQDMIRRVSSRPRLVSDADRDFVNANTLLEEGNTSVEDFGLSVDDTSDDIATGAASSFQGIPTTTDIASHAPSTTLPFNRRRSIESIAATVDSIDDSDRRAIAIDNIVDDMSAYYSCLNDSEHQLQSMSRIPSTLDLEGSFLRKASLSFSDHSVARGGVMPSMMGLMDVVPPEDVAYPEDQDEEKVCPTAAAANPSSTKRKRPSNQPYFMTPRSSYADFMVYHPMSIQASAAMASKMALPSASSHGSSFVMMDQPISQSTHQEQKSMSLLLDLPEVTVLSIASHLSLQDVRTLASTSHSIRGVLLTSVGATQSIWVEKMRECFPSVFTHYTHSKKSIMVKDGDDETSAGGLDLLLRAETTKLRPSQNNDLLKELRAQEPIPYSKITFQDDYQLPIPGLLINSLDCSTRDKVNLPLLTGLLPERYPQGIDAKSLYTRVRLNQPLEKTFRQYNMPIDDVFNQVHENEGDKAFTNQDEKVPQVVHIVQYTGVVGNGDRCIRSDKPFPANPRKISCSSHDSCRCEVTSSSTSSFGGISSWMKNHTPKRTGRKSRARSNSVHSSSTESSSHHCHTSFAFAHHSSPFVVAASLPSLPSQHSPLFRFLSSLSHHCTSTYSSSSGSERSDESSNVSSEDRAIEDGLNNYGIVGSSISKQHAGLVSKCKKCLGKLRHNLKVTNGLRPFVVPTVISDAERGGLVVDLTPRLVAYFEVTIVGQASTTRNNAEVADIHRGQGGGALHPINQQPDMHGHRGDQHPHECVAIGLSSSFFNTRYKMPGWDIESYGYHGDDGGLFHGQGDMLRRYGPSYGPGDTIGCGLEYSTRMIFFVKNGEFLGYAFDKTTVSKDIVERGLYPTIGVDTQCPIYVNYGETPFKFDLKEFAAGLE